MLSRLLGFESARALAVLEPKGVRLVISIVLLVIVSAVEHRNREGQSDVGRDMNNGNDNVKEAENGELL